MLFEGMEAKAEAAATTELLGDVMPLLLKGAAANAKQMRAIAGSFERMAVEFRALADEAEQNNAAILEEFEDQANKLEAKARTMPRQSITKSLLAVAANIRAATKKK